MLGDAIAAELPGLRAEAESLMADSCTIAASTGEPVWDEDNGVWTSAASDPIYSGKCRVRQPAAGSNQEAGEASFTVSDRVVSIPIAGDGYADGVTDVPVGSAVTITATVGDQFMVGKVFTYISPASEQTYPTARRLLCRGVD